MLTHKKHDCGRRRILMLCMKNPCMTRNLECGLRYSDGALLVLYSSKKQWTVNVIVQCSTISSAYLEKTKSPTPGFNKMALLRTQLIIPLNFCMRFFGEHISRNLWPPRSPDLTPPDFCLSGVANSAVCRDRPRTLNEVKTAITAYIRNITQADLQKMFANKIKRVQACIDARGHHITSNTFYKCTSTFRTYLCVRHLCHHISTGLYRTRSAQRLSERTVLYEHLQNR